MKIYLATGNQGKKREMAEIFAGHEILTPADAGIVFDPQETGKTFYENSLIKARSLFELVKAPVIADDSGICVDALGGRPGIYSARYGGKNASCGMPNGEKIPQSKQNEFLIAELNEALANCAYSDKKSAAPGYENALYSPQFLNGHRSCHYTCAMVLYMGQDKLFVAQDTMEGYLIERIEDARGNGGFGYDPIVVLPNGKTVAELSDDEKNEISHRGKAARAILKMFENCF